MIISKSRMVAFVHVQKTGGKSVTSMLQSAIPDARRIGGMHGTAMQAPRRVRRQWQEYYSFAFVRNPWDRAVSWWRYNGWGPFPEFVRNCHDHGQRHKLLWRDQMEYVTDKRGIVIVTKVFRFENFADECRVWCADLGLEGVEVLHRGRSRHGHYSTYYDDETREIIAKRYARDIETFGYTFEGDS